MNDLILVSVDDHNVEPPSMFDRHIPATDKDKVLHVVKKDGADVWVYEGKYLPNIGLNGVVERPTEEFGFEPSDFYQMSRGAWVVKARVNDINANGVPASVGLHQVK